MWGTVGLLEHEAYEDGTLYTIKGVVTEVDKEARLTTFVDTEGECWRFKGVKNWNEGDEIILTMNNNFTPQILEDDKVVGARKG